MSYSSQLHDIADDLDENCDLEFPNVSCSELLRLVEAIRAVAIKVEEAELEEAAEQGRMHEVTSE